MLKKILILPAVVFMSLSSSLCLAWGAKGHQIIAYVGGNIAGDGHDGNDGQAFWQSNLNPLRQLTTVPDRVWKSNGNKSNEAPNHFFQADFYYEPTNYDQIVRYPTSYSEATHQYGEAVVIKNGTAPWRARQLYAMALQALKAGDMKTALQDVGAMSHYIGDISQPLHVSENYDGQMTNNSGIHSYFETTIIQNENAIRAEVQVRAQNLLSDANFLSQFNGTLMDILLLEVERSIGLKDLILSNDTKYGRNSNGAAIQLEIAKDRLADGAATFALILNRLWKESGVVAHSSPMTIQDPAFIRNDYGMSSMHEDALSDDQDCSL